MIRPPGCCLAGSCDQGCGEAYLCFGGYLCPPQWLKGWSIREQIGNNPNIFLGDLQLVGAQNQGMMTANVVQMNPGYAGY